MAMLKAKIQAELQQSGRNKQRHKLKLIDTNGDTADLAFVLALVQLVRNWQNRRGEDPGDELGK